MVRYLKRVGFCFRYKLDIRDSSKQKSNHKRSDRNRSKHDLSLNHNRNEIDPIAKDSSQQQSIHKYTLRSQSRSFIEQTSEPSHSKKSTSERRKLVALGATSSQPTAREEQEPSRLARSGVVLRRSTRNSKGKGFISSYISFWKKYQKKIKKPNLRVNLKNIYYAVI
jgi:hypothetical protein